MTVNAAHFPTAGGMFRAALATLPASPSLLWLDVPCDSNAFNQGDLGTAAAVWAAERGVGGDVGVKEGDGPSGDRHWSSLAEVRRAP